MNDYDATVLSYSVSSTIRLKGDILVVWKLDRLPAGPARW